MTLKPVLLALALSVLNAPAFAQEAAPVPAAEEPAETGAADADIPKERLELAERMHDIWPIRTRIESAIDVVAQGFPAERQAEIKATIRKSIQFDEIEEASIRAMADTYTEEELQAMIGFYGSDVGRAVSAKTKDYEGALAPVFGRMMDKAMMDLRLGVQK